MAELDIVWAEMLQSAIAKADINGNTDLADYLRLKATNDAIRSAASRWLFATAVETALGSDLFDPHERSQIKVERLSPHRFRSGSSNMAGEKIIFRLGVRCLEIQAGWTRTPSDGFMRGQALAVAEILHFGMPRRNAFLRLLRTSPLPQWFDETNAVFTSADLSRHLAMFVGT